MPCAGAFRPRAEARAANFRGHAPQGVPRRLSHAPHERTPPMPLKEKIVKASERLLRLDPGDLAELRRHRPATRRPSGLLAARRGMRLLDDPAAAWMPHRPNSGDPDAKGREQHATGCTIPNAASAGLCRRRRPNWQGGAGRASVISETRLGALSRRARRPARGGSDAHRPGARREPRPQASGVNCVGNRRLAAL